MTRATVNALSPKKLLHTKWTAVVPLGSPVVSIEIEAVHSRRARVIAWRELQDATQWHRGWV